MVVGVVKRESIIILIVSKMGMLVNKFCMSKDVR